MKIKEILWSHRYDYTALMECEHCGHTQKDPHGYNDANYHENVIPHRHFCQHCHKNRLGDLDPRFETKQEESAGQAAEREALMRSAVDWG